MEEEIASHVFFYISTQSLVIRTYYGDVSISKEKYVRSIIDVTIQK